MVYTMKVAEADVFGQNKYVNALGNTECVEFVRQVTNAPQTSAWRQGKKISEACSAGVVRGTAIATFDASGKYPTDNLGKHAAIYLSHTAQGITVLDQWAGQQEVRQRTIRFDRPKGTKRSNDAATFYVID